MNPASVVLTGLLALAVAWPVAAQTTKAPADDAMKIAAAAGVYIGMMENCKADTKAIRTHYRDRIAKTAGDDGGKALDLFEGAIRRSSAEAATRHVPGACEKTRAAPWTEFQKVIDGLLEGKWRF
ncbi:MAG: hypothetical protein V3T02_06780 [Alphaproteobacteria bacterium]